MQHETRIVLVCTRCKGHVHPNQVCGCGWWGRNERKIITRTSQTQTRTNP
jgi:hypothetical protein